MKHRFPSVFGAQLLLLLLLLLVLVAATAFADSTTHSTTAFDADYQPEDRPKIAHHCIHDELERKAAARPNAQSAIVADVVYRPKANNLLSRVRRQLSLTGASTRATAEWQPIRISVFTEDLDDPAYYCSAASDVRSDYDGSYVTCTSAQVLTAAKKDLLINYLVPKAIQLHEDRLSVEPVDRIVVSRGDFGDFHVPEEHFTTGVANTDFILYLAAAPISGNTVAWATTAQASSDGRPLVGIANISPEFIANSTYTIRTMAHEILHALGFAATNFQGLKHADGSSALLSVSGLRNKPQPVPAIDSEKALAAAQAHYGCPSMQYVELEDFGGSGSASSHWKMRNAKDELMSPVAGSGIYTAMTIALMEDLGFYKGNYDKAEPMSYGANVGCDLFEKLCIISGSPLEPSMFCSSVTENYQCPSDRLALGYCRIDQYTSSLPSYMQYFSQPTYGGSSLFMDYCPALEGYSNTGCNNGDQSFMPGCVISPASRCLDVTTASGITVSGTRQSMTALCVDVKCSSTAQTYQIRVKGSDTFVDCPVGTTVSPRAQNSALFGSGELECPPYSEVCYENIGSAFGSDAAASEIRLGRVVAHSLAVLFLSLLVL